MVDLCDLLVKMGADIDGIGTSRIVVNGVERGSLRAADHRTVPDRIQAATYLAAVAVAGGELEVVDARPEHMENLLARFAEMGLELTVGEGSVRVAADGRLRAIDVPTLPYPGIATDYKPLIITMLSVADGAGIVTENLYPGRFRYVEELIRLGANIRTTGHHAVVRGVPRLSGAPVQRPRHPRRCGDGGRRPRRRRRDHDQRGAPHRPGVRRPRRPARRCRRRHRAHLSCGRRRDRRPAARSAPCWPSLGGGTVDAPLGDPQQPGHGDHRGDDQQDLVPAALVGEKHGSLAHTWLTPGSRPSSHATPAPTRRPYVHRRSIRTECVRRRKPPSSTLSAN